MRLALNADVGEGMPSDAALMPYLDMASIACGGHAGDSATMQQTLALAAEFNVLVGAHPSYPDREHFGRRSIAMEASALIESLSTQLLALRQEALTAAVNIAYVKPHGALYNDMMCNESLLRIVLDVVRAELPGSKLMLLSTPDYPAIADICAAASVQPIFEVFADRAYTVRGSLVARSEPGAVLTQEQSLRRVGDIIERGVLLSVDGREFSMPMQSLCVHGDNPAAIATVQQIRELMPRG
ncbi:MAG: 5-oxoprolinase subunit PxpA [Pseudomonadota bacterium]|jgi:UPF0271 protein